MTNIQIICKLQYNLLHPQEIMKNYIFLLFFTCIASGCYDDVYQDQNLIPNIAFSTLINMRLPANQKLMHTTGYVVLSNLGHRGVIVLNRGTNQSVDQYLAFDLACPHIEVQSCVSPMDISNSLELKNSCAEDGVFYRFYLGYSETYRKDENEKFIPVEGTAYELQQYKVIQVGPEELRISNY